MGPPRPLAHPSAAGCGSKSAPSASKEVNGTLVKQWVYQDALKPAAELDGTGHLVSTFIYGSNPNLPDYVLRSGNRYRILADQLGSPRMVINVDNATDVPWEATYTASSTELLNYSGLVQRSRYTATLALTVISR